MAVKAFTALIQLQRVPRKMPALTDRQAAYLWPLCLTENIVVWASLIYVQKQPWQVWR